MNALRGPRIGAGAIAIPAYQSLNHQAGAAIYAHKSQRVGGRPCVQQVGLSKLEDSLYCSQ